MEGKGKTGGRYERKGERVRALRGTRLWGDGERDMEREGGREGGMEGERYHRCVVAEGDGGSVSVRTVVA